MDHELRDLILDVIESSLDAQLRAVRRLCKGSLPADETPSSPRLSQVDMAYDILSKSRSPLHISELLNRMHASFGVSVDRESLVSSISKKIARGDRFVRTGKNTFAVRRR